MNGPRKIADGSKDAIAKHGPVPKGAHGRSSRFIFYEGNSITLIKREAEK